MAVLIRLEPFEGPLDLLLHLIEKAQVDIRDIFVSQITEQYLQSMGQMQTADLEAASEFLAMAATLLEIKSRKLLPQEAEKMAEEEEDPELMLIRQLEEYKLYKQASKYLRLLEERGSSQYTKLPEEALIPPARIELEGLTLEGLSNAFETLLARMTEREREQPVGSIQLETVTVADRMVHVQRMIRAHKQLSFDALFEDQGTRIEIVCTFVALLELLRLGRICIAQQNMFGDIIISAKKHGKAGEDE